MLISEAGSQAVLSEKIEKAPAQISQWLNASINSKTGKPRAMSNAIARELEKKMGKPTGWMDMPEAYFSEEDGIYVIASPGRPTFQRSAVPAPASAIPYSATKVKEVPVVGKGSGGAMPERIWTDGDYPVGKTGECADIATNDPHAFLVGVDGPSMIPRFNPSEFALVEPGTDPELEDDVLVRLTTGETMIKRLLSRRDGWRFGSYNNQEVLHYGVDEVTWVYYIAHPVPRRKIKSRC